MCLKPTLTEQKGTRASGFPLFLADASRRRGQKAGAYRVCQQHTGAGHAIPGSSWGCGFLVDEKARGQTGGTAAARHISSSFLPVVTDLSYGSLRRAPGQGGLEEGARCGVLGQKAVTPRRAGRRLGVRHCRSGSF